MTKDFRHQLWLIYSQLKDAEDDSDKRLELLSRSRQELGEIINQMNRQAEPIYAMLSSAGAKGGAVRTKAKATAARANGAKGGRPAFTYFCQDCAPGSDDPDNERLIDCSGSTYAHRKQCSECGRRPAYYRLA